MPHDLANKLLGDPIMKPETKQLARQMYSTVMTTATGLDTISKEERAKLFKEAAMMCFEAVESEIL